MISVRKALAAVLFAAGAGCSSSTEGIELELGLIVHNSEASPAHVRHGGTFHADPFENDEGFTVDIEKAYFVVTGAELVVCEETALLPKWLSFTGTAHAHTETTPTKSGVPYVIDASEAVEEPAAIGTAMPPPGRYCTAKITIGPADTDAEGLPEEGPELVGKSLYLSGVWGGSSTPFVFESDDTVVVNLTFTDEEGDPSPLVLDDPAGASVTIGATYDTWLDGVDFDSMTPDQQVAAALASVADSLQQFHGETGGHEH